MSQGTALIKFSKNEIELLINSLHMSISTVVPCVENGEWKKPYETIQKDLIDIKLQLIEFSINCNFISIKSFCIVS